MENSKQSAFPFVGEHTNPNGNVQYYTEGLTKHEYFAGKAMQGLMATLIPLENNHMCPNLENVKYCADLAVTAADELLKSLSKHTGQEPKLIVADLRKLEKQVLLGEISYSRMVEIINEKFTK